jgi:hypothetical protein
MSHQLLLSAQILVLSVGLVRGWLYANGLFEDCKSVWEIVQADNDLTIVQFQQWLLYRQYDNEVCNNGVLDIIHDYGIGSAIVQGTVVRIKKIVINDFDK